MRYSIPSITMYPHDEQALMDELLHPWPERSLAGQRVSAIFVWMAKTQLRLRSQNEMALYENCILHGAECQGADKMSEVFVGRIQTDM
jgi:hypothetical protein